MPCIAVAHTSSRTGGHCMLQKHEVRECVNDVTKTRTVRRLSVSRKEIKGFTSEKSVTSTTQVGGGGCVSGPGQGHLYQATAARYYEKRFKNLSPNQLPTFSGCYSSLAIFLPS